MVESQSCQWLHQRLWTEWSSFRAACRLEECFDYCCDVVRLFIVIIQPDEGDELLLTEKCVQTIPVLLCSTYVTMLREGTSTIPLFWYTSS